MGNMISYVETFQRICFPCKLNSQCFQIPALLGTSKDYEDDVEEQDSFLHLMQKQPDRIRTCLFAACVEEFSGRPQSVVGGHPAPPPAYFLSRNWERRISGRVKLLSCRRRKHHPLPVIPYFMATLLLQHGVDERSRKQRMWNQIK